MGLKDLLKQREENFRDHTQRCKKKTQVALMRLFHPFTLLSLFYLGFMIYNIIMLQKEKFQQVGPLDKTNITSRVIQNIITLIFVFILVIMDIYLRIQRLNYRVYNIDSKIQQLIEQFENKQKSKEDNWMKKFYDDYEEKEFSYYQNCFTWTLRKEEWKKIPNNTLAEGDLIRLLPNEQAPALIEAIIELNPNTYLFGSQIGGFTKINVQSSPQSTMFFNKGSKVTIINNVLKGQYYQPNPEGQNVNEAFENCMKEYQIFKVLKTPCVQDLTEFITNMEARKNQSKNLLYFQNAAKAEKVVNIFQIICWVICLAINVAYITKDYLINNFDQNVYLPLIGYSFIVPQVFNILEAWANALMLTLFNSLQSQDYNKKLVGSQNFFKLLKKSSSVAADQKNLNLLMQPSLKKKKQVSIYERIKQCFTCNKRKKKLCANKKKKVRKSQKKELKQIINGYVKTENFYENYDFQIRGWRKNFSKFLEFVQSGSNHLNNIFAAMASVSVFAFVDKEGIISETGKYVDEIAMINNLEQKIVPDLVHDDHVHREEEIYSFEKPNIITDNLPLLKALGVSFMLAKNPKETEDNTKLKEVFIKDQYLHDQIKDNIGFHFYNAFKNEMDAHQDCLCPLSKLIGHTETSFHNYEQQFSIWNIKPNISIDEQETEKRAKKDKLHRSQEILDNSGLGNFEMKSQEDDDAKMSVRSLESLKVKPIFAEQKKHKQMLLERENKFGHLVTNIVKDKLSNKYQSFSRGEANVIFQYCSDYWNGEKVVPIKKEVKHHIKDILFQWQATDFVTIGFSYKPLTPEIQNLIQTQKISDDYKNKDVLEQFQKNQIFLGIVGLKHHKKLEANKMFQSLEEAGVRGVIFSKDRVLETKSFAKELGIDSDWNAWISLAEDPSDFTKLYNQDGHLILPYGINGIKKHLEEVDKIPLQVPMFCDTTADTTRQMFEIYQENGDVVACIGNIINSENLHIFQQANVAIGMMIEPSYRCYRCNGRISRIQKNQQMHGAFSSLTLQRDYQPSKLEKLSAAINALGCTFVFDANTNIYCFYPVFREARRLREGVEQGTLLALFLYLCLFLILFIDLVLGLNNSISEVEACYILIFSIPFAAFTCLSRPSKNSIMKRHVLSPKYLSHLDYAVFLLKQSVVKMIMAAIIFYGMKFYYYRNMIRSFKERYPVEFYKDFQSDDGVTFDNFGEELRFLFFAGWYKLQSEHTYWRLSFELQHKFNCGYILLIFCFLQIGFESPLYTLFYKFTRNIIFKYQLLLQIIITVVYYVLSSTVFLGSGINIKETSSYYYPSYEIWLMCIGGLVVLILFEEVTKRKIRTLFERDHLRLKIFFSTKLGMWSPK